MIKLYHKDKLIGTITNVGAEDAFEMSGDIDLTPAADEYRPVFAYLTDEEAIVSGAKPPFDQAYLDNWFLEDEQGVRKEILCPGIYYDDKEVFWRE
ncbi:MAG TPA: hypothetical protein V6D08_09480 [Candidatus Obscuribacterales bacterium]